MRVHRVDLAELGFELSDFQEQVRRKMRERDEAFLDLDSPVGKRDEEVGPGVGIDDRLEGDFRFVDLKRRLVLDPVLAGNREEVPDDRDRRIEVRPALGAADGRRSGGRSFRRRRRGRLRRRLGGRGRSRFGRGLLREGGRRRRQTEAKGKEKFSGWTHENLLEKLGTSRGDSPRAERRSRRGREASDRPSRGRGRHGRRDRARRQDR